MNLSQNDSDIPMCQCDPPQPAAVRTVQKDGPNKVVIKVILFIVIVYGSSERFGEMIKLCFEQS